MIFDADGDHGRQEIRGVGGVVGAGDAILI